MAGGREDPRVGAGLPYYARDRPDRRAGELDSLFLADNIAIAEYRVEYLPQTLFDPIEMLSALAAVTERIGLIATGSTTYSAPWDLARRFATLDFLSAGRAGWNIVTTRSVLAAANFGRDEHPAHAERYAARDRVRRGRAARVGRRGRTMRSSARRRRGVWADRSKLHAPRFHGEHFEVAGILPFPRSPQGHPVLVQAGVFRLPASSSPPTTRSWCSPASRRSRTRSRFAASCARRPRPPDARPTTSTSCRR